MVKTWNRLYSANHPLPSLHAAVLSGKVLLKSEPELYLSSHLKK